MKYLVFASLMFSLFGVLFLAGQNDLMTTGAVVALCTGYVAIWRGERNGAFDRG
jgi:hypothetical protein